MADVNGTTILGVIEGAVNSQHSPDKHGTVADLGAGSDVSSPLLFNQIPAPGVTVLPDTPVQFDISDDKGFTGVVLWVWQGTDLESVFDDELESLTGQGFIGKYQLLSSVTDLPNNVRRFVLRRSGGWRAAPIVRYRVFDTSGNEAS